MSNDSPMNVGHLIGRMASVPAGLRALVAPLPRAEARWKPADGAWSVCEVVWHLAEEEERDFPARLRRTIDAPGEAWDPIDPEGWAREGAYNERDVEEGLRAFEQRRAAHVPWLRTLTDHDLASVYRHPQWGPVPASVLLASWSAHDALHLRQIAKRLYQLTAERDAPGVDLRYAGAW